MERVCDTLDHRWDYGLCRGADTVFRADPDPTKVPSIKGVVPIIISWFSLLYHSFTASDDLSDAKALWHGGRLLFLRPDLQNSFSHTKAGPE